MTRETKIGLLVGLAFIIVIGILLSDHIQSSTQPPQAMLSNVGNNVRQGVNAPGSTAPPITFSPPTEISPQQHVPSSAELNPGHSVVKIGPSPAPTGPGSTGITITGPPQVGNDSNTPITALDKAARDNHEELVPVDVGPAPQPAAPIVMVATRSPEQYEAVAGDNLSKLATKFLGANTKANRDAIIKANAVLADNPDMIIVGKTYTIPAASPSAANTLAGSVPESAPSHEPTIGSPSTPALTERPLPGAAISERMPQHIYTVKERDTLWRIASEQLGTSAAVPAIQELNKDVLKGESHDRVIVGMKLRLPAKPIASMN